MTEAELQQEIRDLIRNAPYSPDDFVAKIKGSRRFDWKTSPYGQAMYLGRSPEQEQPPVVPPVEPPPPSTGRFQFRAIYCRDEEFDQCYPDPFKTMNLSIMECYIYSGTTNIKKRMDQLVAPDMGWSLLSSFTPSSTGGSFRLSDTDVVTIVKSVKDHPRNSHHYYIADEPNLTNYSVQAQDANRNTLSNRAKLISQNDPVAKVWIADYRQAQLDPVASNRPGGMWGGLGFGVMLSGYPSPNVDQDPQRIPNQAKWCDAAGIDYIGCISCHDYQGNAPAWPTVAQFSKAGDQWAATKAQGIILYIYYDAEGTKHLSDDPAMQQSIGQKMLTLAT